MPFKRLPSSYKRYTKYREVFPDEDSRAFPSDWLGYGPRDWPIPQTLLEQPMRDIAEELVGRRRTPLKSFRKPSKRHRVALDRHWRAGRVKFEVGSRDVTKPILDEDGELLYEDEYTEEETFVSPKPELWTWWEEEVASESGGKIKPVGNGEAPPQAAGPGVGKNKLVVGSVADLVSRTPTSSRFDVFLSHNRKDKPAIRRLKKKLVAKQLTVWLDEDELRPGIPWQQLLEAGIKASGSVAVVVGKDGLGPWEDEEMQAALVLAVKDKRPVIPVLLPGAATQPELPMFLVNRNWVDLRQGLAETGLANLVWGITGEKRCRTTKVSGA